MDLLSVLEIISLIREVEAVSITLPAHSHPPILLLGLFLAP